jgi:hypothetical protein
MKLNHPVLKINSQKTHSLLDRRYAERVPIRYRISYSGEEGARIVTGEGILKDLSKTGCKILGATTSSLGSSLTCSSILRMGRPRCASPTSPFPGSIESHFPSDSPSCQRKSGSACKE